MRKSFWTVLGGAVAIFISGCAAQTATNEWKETRALQEKYEVVGPEVTGHSSFHNIWFVWWGDNGFINAKHDAMAKNPKAEDLINMSTDRNDYYMWEPFYGSHSYVLTGVPIKYTGKKPVESPIKK